jgi:hypothetical protein
MFQLGTWLFGRSVTILAAVLLLFLPTWGGVSAQPAHYDAYYGNYLVTPRHLLGVDNYITDSGESAMLFSDYQFGIVSMLFPISETEFVMGPGFDDQTPVELHVQFVKDEHGTVTGISMRSSKGESTKASRVSLREENVVVNNGPVTLAGTLFTPREGTFDPNATLTDVRNRGNRDR